MAAEALARTDYGYSSNILTIKDSILADRLRQCKCDFQRELGVAINFERGRATIMNGSEQGYCRILSAILDIGEVSTALLWAHRKNTSADVALNRHAKQDDKCQESGTVTLISNPSRCFRLPKRVKHVRVALTSGEHHEYQRGSEVHEGDPCSSDKDSVEQIIPELVRVDSESVPVILEASNGFQLKGCHASRPGTELKIPLLAGMLNGKNEVILPCAIDDDDINVVRAAPAPARVLAGLQPDPGDHQSDGDDTHQIREGGNERDGIVIRKRTVFVKSHVNDMKEHILTLLGLPNWVQVSSIHFVSE